MLLNFFDTLRRRELPVTIGELLDLIAALKQQIVFADIDQFYYLARTCLIKKEIHFDKYDLAFKEHFEQLAKLDGFLEELLSEAYLSNELIAAANEEDSQTPKLPDGDPGLADRQLKESNQAYEGPFGLNKAMGSVGTSIMARGKGSGSKTLATSGVNVGEGTVNAWDRRDFKDLDDSVQLGTRTIKMALRRLRRFARTGAEQELDMNATIRATAHNGGLLDIKMMAERHNSVKVLLLFDIGGSMDAHVRTCEELFSAARAEFKHMEYFYFHNFIYETLWRNNKMNHTEVIPTFDLLHKYGSDYKVIFIGDAAMGTQEILRSGGSVDLDNAEPGANWLKRVTDTFDKVVWLNPEPEGYWKYSQSTGLIQNLMDKRMYPLTLKGLEQAMSYLAH
jgi:uncharacterized protein with von Willebrand factor type A (vWA) domain